MPKQKELHNNFGLKPKRKCHDCGKPTNNYRCSACWAKIRENCKEDFDLLDSTYHTVYKNHHREE